MQTITKFFPAVESTAATASSSSLSSSSLTAMTPSESKAPQPVMVKKKEKKATSGDKVVKKPRDKTPHKKIWGPYTSSVVEKVDGKEVITAGQLECVKCKNRISVYRGAKTKAIQWQNVSRHFFRCHGEFYNQVLAKFKEENERSEKTALDMQIDENIETFEGFSTGQIPERKNEKPNLVPLKDCAYTKEQKALVNIAWAAAIVLDEAPLRACEGAFADAFEFATGYRPPSQVTTHNLILEMANAHWKNLKSTFKLVRESSPLPLFSLTSDVWKATDKESYLGVSVTYAKPWDLTFHTELIGLICLNEHHTAENLSEEIMKILVDFNICDEGDTCAREKLFSSCRDNASTALATSERLQVLPIGCASHSIQLVLSDAIKSLIPDPHLALNAIIGDDDL